MTGSMRVVAVIHVPDSPFSSVAGAVRQVGTRITEAPDRLMYGSTRFMFLKLANAQPSAGSAVDHVGFSVADIDAKFKEFAVDERFHEDWDKYNIWRYESVVKEPAIRAYSMANYPEESDIIMLNVRIATPPPGTQGIPPGIMSSYIFNLKPGDKVRGTTIAEMGAGNRVLDMIVYKKGAQEFLLTANNSRGVMKITTASIERAESITAPVGGGGTQGQKYETIEAWKGVEQLDKLSATHAVVIRKTEAGALNLESLPLP